MAEDAFRIVEGPFRFDAGNSGSGIPHWLDHSGIRLWLNEKALCRQNHEELVTSGRHIFENKKDKEQRES